MRIKIRRMSNAARLLLSGANAPHEGELVYTTDTKLTYIGDGTTTGGNLINAVTGSIAGVGAPTAAPTAANPATCMVNGNDEVFYWRGSSWSLVGNHYHVSQSQTTVTRNINIGSFVVEKSVVCPRAGLVSVVAGCALTVPSAPASFNNQAYNIQAVVDKSNSVGTAKTEVEFGILGVVSGPSFGRGFSPSGVFEVAAGEAINLYSYFQVNGGTGTVNIDSSLELVYLK